MFLALQRSIPEPTFNQRTFSASRTRHELTKKLQLVGLAPLCPVDVFRTELNQENVNFVGNELSLQASKLRMRSIFKTMNVFSRPQGHVGNISLNPKV